MAKCTEICILFFSLSILFYTVIGDRCVQRTPCICEYDDGRIIDLNPLASGDNFITADDHNLTYYFHPCSNKKTVFPKDLKNITSNCDLTSLCLLNRTDSTAKSLGDAKNAQFVLNSGKYNIYYEFDKFKTAISLACTDLEETVLHAKPVTNKQFSLILFSTKTCEHYEKHGLSTGSVLVILLMIFTSVYLLGGAAILHFLRGARGREMIPNYDFWTDLPILVKDGAVFLQNGCKPVISSSESYDRI